MITAEQLQVIEALTMALKENDPEVRREAFACLVQLGVDGIGCITDAIDNAELGEACRQDAMQALEKAFSEGRVEAVPIAQAATHALERRLSERSETLCEAAVNALGAIGPQAIALKPKLLGLLDSKKENKRICVKVAAALLKISPIK